MYSFKGSRGKTMLILVKVNATTTSLVYYVAYGKATMINWGRAASQS